MKRKRNHSFEIIESRDGQHVDQVHSYSSLEELIHAAGFLIKNGLTDFPQNGLTVSRFYQSVWIERLNGIKWIIDFLIDDLELVSPHARLTIENPNWFVYPEEDHDLVILGACLKFVNPDGTTGYINNGDTGPCVTEDPVDGAETLVEGSMIMEVPSGSGEVAIQALLELRQCLINDVL